MNTIREKLPGRDAFQDKLWRIASSDSNDGYSITEIGREKVEGIEAPLALVQVSKRIVADLLKQSKPDDEFAIYPSDLRLAILPAMFSQFSNKENGRVHLNVVAGLQVPEGDYDAVAKPIKEMMGAASTVTRRVLRAGVARSISTTESNQQVASLHNHIVEGSELDWTQKPKKLDLEVLRAQRERVVSTVDGGREGFESLVKTAVNEALAGLIK